MMKKSNIISLYPSAGKMLERSEGCYLFDMSGRQFVDFESGVWCVNLGHSNGRIVKVIERQSKKSIHHGYKFRNHDSETLAKQLNNIIGYENGDSVFLSSGSEAVNLAITIAMHITGRKKILKIDNTYLSAFGYGQISPENDRLATVRFDDLNSVDNIAFDDIAAFVVETGGASIDVVKFPDNAFVEKLIDLSQKSGVLIIAEEVTTGMGRTGRWFGFQHYGFSPDMVVTGKALGNGYPVSAVTISEKIAALLDNNPFRYAQSHQNDPLGCAVGLEVIKAIKEDGLIERSSAIGVYFKEQLDGLKYRHPSKIEEVRGRGVMLALEFSEQVDGEAINNGLFEAGFVVGFKLNTLRFLPPLIIGIKDIDKLIGEIDKQLSV